MSICTQICKSLTRESFDTDKAVMKKSVEMISSFTQDVYSASKEQNHSLVKNIVYTNYRFPVELEEDV